MFNQKCILKSGRPIRVFFVAIICMFSIGLHAAPHRGDVFDLKQPDGSRVTVKAWGDEYYQRIESVDGYSLIRNEYGWICYADLSADGDAFVATDIVYEGIELDRIPDVKHYLQASWKLKKGLTINPASRKTKAAKHKKQLNKSKTDLLLAAPGQAGEVEAEEALTAAAPLTGSVVGLTILVDFPEESSSITTTQVNNYCNQIGYSEDFNNGSVRDYYDDVSNGLLEYTNIVVGYYTAANSKDYYNDPSQSFGTRARELVGEALNWLENDQQFDFTQLSTDSSNYILAINVFYAGQPDVGWSVGLWPHASQYYGFTSNSGVKSASYQITNLGSALTLRTFCHENGHMICKFPDLYDYGDESNGIGDYGLMGYGGSNTNPIPPNPYLRDLKGWESIVEINNDAPGTVRECIIGFTPTYRYSHPTNPKEFFLIENRIKYERDQYLPDDGLLIWHIDEDGDNDNEQMTLAEHYKVSVEQADGLFGLENKTSYGGSGDLFHAGDKDAFNDTTLPDAKWWDGSDSGLAISHISEPLEVMTFVVNEQEMYPPVAYDDEVAVTDSSGVVIDLIVTDDGFPTSPGQLSYTITSLPEHGWLFDPNDGLEIMTTPYTLQNDANSVIYEPCPYYFTGTDGFTFKANDGGDAPDGGDSNIATVNLVMNMLSDTVYQVHTIYKDYIPFMTGYKKVRSQALYHADELGSKAQVIANLALNIQTPPAIEIQNLTIRMKHTMLTEYPSSGAVFDNTGWTVVYDANEIITQTGWHEFDLQNTFAYDGVNNLMIDFSFDNTLTSTGYGYVYDSSFETSAIPQMPSDKLNQYRTITYWSNSGNPLEFVTPNYKWKRLFNLTLKTQPDTEVLFADFNYNCSVGTEDLMTMIDTWLAQEGDPGYNSGCDISVQVDKKVNLADFAVLASEWLLTIE